MTKKFYPSIKIGDQFGKWIVLEEVERRGTNRYYLCQCSCIDKTKSEVAGSKLNNSGSVCCGCQNGNGNLTEKEAKQTILYCAFYPKKGNSKKYGYKFDLSIGEYSLLIQQNCAYSGLISNHYARIDQYLSSFTKENGAIKIHTLDRIDSKLGYEIGNIVACDININYGKNSQEYIEFIKWINDLKINIDKITVQSLNTISPDILLKDAFPLKYKMGENSSFTNYLLYKISRMKRVSKKRNKKVELSDRQIAELMIADCVICDRKVNKDLLYKNFIDKLLFNYILNGIDRWDNLKDYTVENSTTLCYYCNAFKNTMSIENLREIIIVLKNNLHKLPKTTEEFLEQHSFTNTIQSLIQQVENGKITDYFDELPRLKEKLKLYEV